MDRTSPGILLFKGKGFISGAIRWQTRSCYSHAALLLRGGRILESWQGAGVRVREPLTDWTDVDVFDVPAMDEQMWAAAEDFAAKYIGAGYDYRSVLRFLSRREVPAEDKWFCSEYVFASIRASGLSLLRGIEPQYVSPAHISWSPFIRPRSIA